MARNRTGPTLIAATTAAVLGVGFLTLPAPALAEASGGDLHTVLRGTAEAPVSIVREPGDLPGPLAKRGPQKVVVDLETVEVYGRLDDGTAYHYWTFDGKVPGPFVRVRVGDTVEVRLTNAENSVLMHNVDFHAVTGPGGGARATEAAPGEAKGFTFKALNPGLYVYHCATPPVAQHIAAGMYGLILVEPENGLTAVDREYYVMQGEIYTEEPFGTQGEVSTAMKSCSTKEAEYFVFNGAVGGIFQAAPAQGQSRRDRPGLLWRRRPQRHFVLSRHRRDLRPRVQLCVTDRGAAHRRADGQRPRRRCGDGRVCSGGARQVHAGGPRPVTARARPSRHP